MTTITMPDLTDAEQINAHHRQRWHDEIANLGLDPTDRESALKVPPEVRDEIAEQTRRLFERANAIRDGKPIPDPQAEHVKKVNSFEKAFAWVKDNPGYIGKMAAMATAAEVPEGAMRSVEQKHPAWFKRLASGIFQVVNGERKATPQSTSEQAAGVAAMLKQIMGDH